MRCQRCQKEASVHLTEPIDGQRRELHLCQSCARKAGLSLPESPPNLALDAVVQSLIVANVGELVGELAELTLSRLRHQVHGIPGGRPARLPPGLSRVLGRALALDPAVSWRQPARGQGGPPS